MEKGSMLCIGCLEKRMGRTLMKDDFEFHGSRGNTLSWVRMLMSDRLQHRVRAKKSVRL
jgi:hypothetical protein